MRLNFAQAMQETSMVVGPLLASHVFFKSIKDNSLSSAQLVYLGIAIVVFTFAAIFYHPRDHRRGHGAATGADGRGVCRGGEKALE